MRELEPIAVFIAAPRMFVFQCLTAFGEPSPLWEPGLAPELISSQGRALTVRFRTRVLGRVVPTVKRVRLFPPDRILIEHVEGGRREVRAEVSLGTVGGGTELRVSGDVTVGTPLVGGVVERAAAPAVERSLRRTVRRFRVTIEAAARASGQTDAAPQPDF